MKEALIQRARQGADSHERLNWLREELHHLLLQEIDRKGGFQDLCFVGGTALRVLYQLDRFSEDLDFSTASQVRPSFQLAMLVRALQVALEGYGFDCAVTPVKSIGAVHSCFFRFVGLLAALDPVFHKGQKLAVKCEVDTRPPAGAVEIVSPVTGARLYTVRHYDLPSLFAGKLHATLYRQFTKGRDLYDFLWYVGKNVHVNLELLGNAASQTEGKPMRYTAATLRETLTARFRNTDFSQARRDVEPFVQDPETLRMFDEAVFLAAVSRVGHLT